MESLDLLGVQDTCMDLSFLLPQATGFGGLVLFLTRLGVDSQTGFLFGVAIAGYLLLVRRLDQMLRPIRAAVIEIQTLMTTAGMSVRFLVTETRTSPAGANEIGRRILKESEMEKLVKEKEHILLRQLGKKLPRSPIPYDVQEKALQVLRAHRDRRWMDPVKDSPSRRAWTSMSSCASAR